MLSCRRVLIPRRSLLLSRPSHVLPYEPIRNISRNSAIAKGLRDTTAHAQSIRKRVDEYKQKQQLANLKAGSGQRGDRGERTLSKDRDEAQDEGDCFPAPIPRTKADSEFICGRRSVLSALKARKRQAYKLYLNVPKKLETRPDAYLSEILALAKDAEIACSYDKQVTEEIARREEVGNPLATAFILEASPLRQDQLKSLGKCNGRNNEFIVHYKENHDDDRLDRTNKFQYEQSWEMQQRKPLMLWLHGVTDTGNIGSIVRTAVYMGVDAVLLSTRTTGAITTNSHITSTGATEFINLFRVPQPKDFIEQSQRNGWKFFASVRPETLPESLNQVAFADAFEDRGGISPLSEHPCVVMLGNETDGLPDWIAAKADERISIGGPSKLAEKAGVDSFNVSVAAALLSERFLRQPNRTHDHGLESEKEAKHNPRVYFHLSGTKGADDWEQYTSQKTIRRKLHGDDR